MSGKTKKTGGRFYKLKNIFYSLLIFSLILGLSGGVNAYSGGGGTCNCGNENTALGGSSEDACVDCTSALNDNTNCGTQVNYNGAVAISNYIGTCIDNPVNFTNKIFDCQGNIINGDNSGTGYGINISSFSQEKITIKNCVITDFKIGILAHLQDFYCPSGWSDQQEINIGNTAGNLINYQVKIITNLTDEYNAGKLNSTCKDLRFANTTANLLSYWIEECNTTGGNSTIWVKVPFLKNSTNTSIYMCYGNSFASSESNGTATFELFDDFEKMSEENYFLDDVVRYGASTNIFGPQAVHHNNRTYISLHGKDLDPYAIYYDHVTQQWSDKVYVGENPLRCDGHGSPAILRDISGYLHIFYGSHNSYIQHAKSNNPDNISSWTDKGDIGGSASYPHPILADNGDIYVFYRHMKTSNEQHINYINSIDNGESWSNVTIVNVKYYNLYRGKIAHESGVNERVHFAWVQYSGSKYQNVYYANFKLSNKHLYSADGTDLGTVINSSEAENNCKVYDATNTHMAHTRIDSSGVPHIIFNSNTIFKFTKWNGSAWTTPQNITTTDTFRKSHDFIVHSPTNIESYFNTGNVIEKWNYNGSDWSQDSIIANGSDYDNNLCKPAIVENFTDDLKMTFSQCLLGNNNKAFAYGDSGFIGNPFLVLDTDKWNSTGYVSGGNSKVAIQYANSDIYSKSSHGAGYAIRGYGKLDDNAVAGKATIGFNNDIQDSDCVEIYSYDKQAGANVLFGYTKTSGTPSTVAMDENESSNYRIFDVMWLDSSSVKFRVDEGVIQEITANIPAGQYNVNIYTKNDGDVNEFDWIFVRKYAFPEPTTTFGSGEPEETPANLNFTNNMISNCTHGIYFQNIDNSTIENNNLNSNTYGIYLNSSSNNNIINNTANSNIYHGIYLYSSSNNDITLNSMTGNGDDRVRLSSSNSNYVCGNIPDKTNHVSGTDNTCNGTGCTWSCPIGLETSTNKGTAYIAISNGTIENLIAINESSLNLTGKPNIEFPYGFFSFNITGISSGETITLTIKLPGTLPIGSQYWKYGPKCPNTTKQWYQITMEGDDGDNMITINLTDGSLGDDNCTQDGKIFDDGGPGSPLWIESKNCTSPGPGPKEDIFNSRGPDVCAYGNATGTCSIWVCNDIIWSGGENLTALGCNNTATIGPGTFDNESVMSSSNPGKYDLVLDCNQNGLYDTATDALDNADVADPAGFCITPEPLAAVLFITGLSLLYGLVRVRRKS